MIKEFFQNAKKRLSPMVWFQAAFAVVFLLLMSGCGYFLGSKSESRPIEIADKGRGCVNQIGARIQTWAQSGEPSVADSVDCVIEALDSFAKKTQGHKPDSWSKIEIANFVTTYFDQNIDSFNTWMNESLHLKQALVGGANDRITRDEIARIRSLLIRLKPALESVGPNLDLILLRSETATPKQVDAAASSVLRVSSALAFELKKSIGARPAVSTLSFTDSLGRLGVSSSILDRFRPLVEAGKAVAVGGNKEMILDAEWSRFAEAIGEAWAATIRFKYDVFAREDYLGANLHGLEAAANQALALLENSVEAHGTAGIDQKKIVDLIYVLEGLDLIPLGLTAKSLEAGMPVILGKLFYGSYHSDVERMKDVFKQAHLNTIRDAFVGWLAVQKELNTAFSSEETISKEVLIANFAAMKTPGSRSARDQMIFLLKTGRPLLMDDGHKVLIVEERDARDYRRSDIELLNLARTGIAFFFRAYIHDDKAAKSMLGVTEQELEELYLDMRNLGAEIGLIDLRSKGAGSRTFMEAGLFTSSGDGSARIDLKEAVEWFHFVFSASKIADSLHKEMVTACSAGESLDIFGRQKLTAACYREKFQSGFAKVFTGMPGFLAWLETDETLLGQLMPTLELAGRGAGVTETPIDYSEFRGLIPILYYTESLISRHDRNRNQILDTDELWNAFPIIQPFIRRMGGDNAETESRQQAIYSWLLHFGAPPDSGSWQGPALVAWESARHYYAGETATRLDIVEVISGFALTGRHRRMNQLREYFEERRRTMQSDFKSGNKEVLDRWTELFYCLPEAQPLIQDVVRKNPKIIQGATKSRQLRPEEFINRMRRAISADSRFDHYCAPF